MPHEIIDDVEDLRLDRDQRARAAQLAALRIEHEILELERQGSSQGRVAAGLESDR